LSWSDTHGGGRHIYKDADECKLLAKSLLVVSHFDHHANLYDRFCEGKPRDVAGTVVAFPEDVVAVGDVILKPSDKVI
jgi:hypothetical protein